MTKELHTILNGLESSALASRLESCCAAKRWGSGMILVRPYSDDQDVYAKASEVWWQLDRSDFLEAFSAHPQIGDVKTLQAKYASTLTTASTEQSQVALATTETLEQLALANQSYLKRFGYIFIICATGKSAEEMLESLLSRLGNAPEVELKIAAAEQLKITLLRLQKLPLK